MSQDKRIKLAVLIDADNVPYSKRDDGRNC
jgi:hypothetical protein